MIEPAALTASAKIYAKWKKRVEKQRPKRKKKNPKLVKQKEITVDARKRISLSHFAKHDRYLASLAADGTITLTPLTTLLAMEERLRRQPGYIDKPEYDAAHPEKAIPLDGEKL